MTLLSLAGPIIAGQMAQFGMATIDTVLAGHLNADVLGAVAVGNGLWLIAAVFVVGTMLALPPIVSALDATGAHDEITAWIPQAALIGPSLGVLAGLVLYLAGPVALSLAHTAPALVPGATGFLHASAFGLPGIGLFAASRGITEGMSRTLPSMAIEIAGLVTLAPLGYALMYGAFGVHGLGAPGSGIAMAVASLGQGSAFWLYLRRSPSYVGLDRTRLDWRPDPARLRRLLALGLPIAATLILEVGMFTTASLIVASLGPVAIAGNQIALNIVTIAFLLPLGIASAVTVRVGRANGLGDPAGIRRAALCGIGIAAGFETVSLCCLLSFRHVLVGLYSPDRAVVLAGAHVLLFGALFQIPDGIGVVCGGILRGLRDTRTPMLILGCNYWLVGVPLGAFLSLRFGLGAAGVWIGLIAGLTLSATMLARLVSIRIRVSPAANRAAVALSP